VFAVSAGTLCSEVRVAEMQMELKGFFDSYRDSFPAGPAAIAAFYSEPCVTARGGIVRVNATLADTTALFADVDRQYRDRGYTHADYVPVHSRELGANGVLATIRWTYKNAEDTSLWETTFSYNLYKRGGDWKILVQTLHD
jgi:hypothetical protein